MSARVEDLGGLYAHRTRSNQPGVRAQRQQFQEPTRPVGRRKVDEIEAEYDALIEDGGSVGSLWEAATAICKGSHEVRWEYKSTSQPCLPCFRGAKTIAPFITEHKRHAWKQGFNTGQSRAMRHMSDEPHLSLDAPNPYDG